MNRFAAWLRARLPKLHRSSAADPAQTAVEELSAVPAEPAAAAVPTDPSPTDGVLPAPGGEKPEGSRPRRRALWLGVAALVVLAVGALALAFVVDARSQAALRELEARRIALEQENQRLRAERTIAAPQLAAKLPAAPQTPPAAAAEPAAAPPAPAAVSPASGEHAAPAPRAAAVSGECVVGTEEDLRTTVRECITAFNRAARPGYRTGGQP